MTQPTLPTRLASFVFLAAAAGSTGLFVARAAAELLYPYTPYLLEEAWAMAIALAVALATAAASFGGSIFRRATGMPPVGVIAQRTPAAVVLPLAVLAAALLRPFPDLVWSAAVLAAAVLAVGCALLETSFPLGGSLRRVGRPQLGALLAASVAFAVYLRTLAPSVVVGDSAEFQTVSFTLGIAHPTGYPLYLMLAKGFTLLPIGNVAYRVNLLSAVFAALTVYLLVCTSRRLTGDGRAATVAGLTLAFGGVFWSQAVVAEVYPLNAFFIALVLHLIVRDLDGVGEVAARGKGYLAVWLAFGLSLTHHRTALLLAPALLAHAVLMRRRFLAVPLRAVTCIAVAAVPLLAYLYLPLRWFDATGGPLDWEQFRWHVLGSGYGFAVRPEALFGEPERYGRFFDLLQAQLTLPGFVLGLGGIVALLARRLPVALLTLLCFGGFTLFPLVYRVPDAEVFYIPAFMIFALWFGGGLAVVLAAAGRLAAVRSVLAGVRHLGFAGAALVPALLLVANYAAHDASGDLVLDRWGREALRQPVPTGAIVIADMLRLSALRYFYATEAPERRVEVLMPDTESDAVKIVEGSLQSGRPVYLARYLPGLEKKYRLDASGPLIEITRGTPLTPAMAITAQILLAPSTALAGFTPGPEAVPAGEVWRGTLYWKAEQPLTDSHFVHLRFLDETGAAAYTARPAVPVQGLYPTWAWPVGELIADHREVLLPVALTPGTYEVSVGLGEAFRPPGQWAALGTVHVLPPRVPVATERTLAVFGERLALVGYHWAGGRPGGRGELVLRWQAMSRQGASLVTLHADLVDGDGTALATMQSPLRMPADLSADGAWIEFHQFPLPPETFPGTYRLRIRLDSEDGSLAPVRSGWPARGGDVAVISGFTVSPPAAEALTNLENKAILVRRVLERDELRPGELLRLTLHWRAAARMDLDYTVFVHLLDAAQRVRAQVDAYPAGGARPTSQWRLDELVADPYQIPLPADLPPGEYQLEVGMYRAATMERLQVLDEEERPIDDRVLAGTVRVHQK